MRMQSPLLPHSGVRQLRALSCFLAPCLNSMLGDGLRKAERARRFSHRKLVGYLASSEAPAAEAHAKMDRALVRFSEVREPISQPAIEVCGLVVASAAHGMGQHGRACDKPKQLRGRA